MQLQHAFCVVQGKFGACGMLGNCLDSPNYITNAYLSSPNNPFWTAEFSANLTVGMPSLQLGLTHGHACKFLAACCCCMFPLLPAHTCRTSSLNAEALSLSRAGDCLGQLPSRAYLWAPVCRLHTCTPVMNMRCLSASWTAAAGSPSKCPGGSTVALTRPPQHTWIRVGPRPLSEPMPEPLCALLKTAHTRQSQSNKGSAREVHRMQPESAVKMACRALARFQLTNGPDRCLVHTSCRSPALHDRKWWPGCLQAQLACTQPAACRQAQRMAEPVSLRCLQASYQVTQVQLMNRQDCCRCPLAEAKIYIGDPSALNLAQTVNPLLSQETGWQLCAEVSARRWCGSPGNSRGALRAWAWFQSKVHVG